MSDKDFVPIPPRVTKDVMNELLTEMVRRGGSDLFLLGSRPVVADIYGRKVRLTERRLTDDEVYGLLMEIAGQAARSELGSAAPINDGYDVVNRNLEPPLRRMRFRVNAVSCLRNGRDSITITMRSIPTTPPRATDLGIEKDIRDLCNMADQGLILVTGGTGHGKSTTLAGILREQLEDEEAHRNIVTIEDPIEFVYDEIDMPSSIITQLQKGIHVKSFHGGVVNAMRMKPSTILVGEVRDFETVEAAQEAAVTGHVVFATMHTNSVAETIQRAINLYPEGLRHQARLDLIQAFRLVVTQRLVPSTDGKRVALREYLIFDREVRDQLSTCSNLAAELVKIVDERGRSMVVDAKAKLDEGLITEQTYQRQLVNYNALKKLSQ